jgi:glycosyltransferase involved in cell wall biosynthesis
MNYIVITPVRNEERHFAATVASMVAQTIRPRCWVIVNDGSTDKTGEIAERAASEHPWIHVLHRLDRGYRKQGGGVIEAFYDGFGLVTSPDFRLAKQDAFPWNFLVKLDGDLSFAPDYFANCFAHFADDRKLGIGGGRIYCTVKGNEVEDSPGDPSFHVRGATKIYRRACWEAIGGLLVAPGWDTLDELKANMLGWKTCSFKGLKILQLKATGSADGTWRNWFKNGRANYITGYHPLFMLTKCARRLFLKPIGIGAVGLFCGFLSGYLRRVPQVADQQLIGYLRRQQLNRLLLRESLWS